MPRPTSKDTLLAAANEEHDKLIALLEKLPESKHDVSLVYDVDDGSRNARDVLCHLDAWHRMVHDWHTEGKTGGMPAIPAPGISWAQLPILNARIHDAHLGTTYDDALAAFEASHRLVMDDIAAESADTLFVKKHLPWTGSTSVGAYFVSATSSHYTWAQKLIKRFLKQEPAAGQA